VTKPMRAILPLLKAPITDHGPSHITIALGAQYGAPTTIRIDDPFIERCDIHNGDIVTIYTEVFLKGPTDAKPS